MANVLIISPSRGAYGGIEAFMLELGRYLEEETEFTPSLCFKLVTNQQMESSLIDVLNKSGLPYKVVSRASVSLFNEIAKSDLVHAQNASPDISLLARLVRKPLVLTIHNHLYDRQWMRRLSWKFAASLAQHRLFNSNFVRESWEPIPSTISQVVPTVSHLPFNFAPIADREGFVFVSRLIANKGAEELIRAYQLANIDHAAWPLQIVGDGPMRQYFETLARNAPLPIRFHGFVSDAEKHELIRQARWLAATPNTREDMGLTPLEARANGVPVIATRDGGLPEAAGRDALLCDPKDIASITARLEQAAAMSSKEYETRARQCHDSLQDHLVSMSFYPALYQRLLA